jgi:hypothetical protein
VVFEFEAVFFRTALARLITAFCLFIPHLSAGFYSLARYP